MARKAITVSFIAAAGMFALTMTSVYGQTAVAPTPTEEQPAVMPPDDLQRGREDFRLENYEEAVGELIRARIKDPQSAEAAYYLGITYKKMQLFQKALPNLMEAATLKPPMEQAYLELAEVYFALNRFDEALQTLPALEPIGPGSARTAFLKGQLLTKKRKLAEALAFFGQAKALDPALASEADFQSAAIYLRQGRQAEARALFSAVAARDPESDPGQRAKLQAEALSTRLREGPFKASAGAFLQWDSNVILKPDSAPTGTAISNQSDKVALFLLRAEYAVPNLSAPYGLNFTYALFSSVYEDLTEYNVLSHSLGIAPRYAVADGSLSVPFAYTTMKVDDKDYLQTMALSPVYVFTPAEGRQASVTLRYQRRAYKNTVPQPDENRDSTDLGAGLTWTRSIAGQHGYVNAAYELNKEDATGANWSYLGNKFSVGSLYPLGDALKISLGLSAYVQTFAGTHTAFNQKRKDTTVMLTTQALYGIAKNRELILRYEYVKDSSTIPVYAYGKHVVSMGLSARF